MFRPILPTILSFGLSLALTASLSAQILLDPNVPTQPGIIVGGGNPLLGAAPTGNETNPVEVPGSSPWGDPNSSPYGGGYGYGGYGYGAPGFRIHPKMTREEIIQKQAEMKMWENLALEEQIRQTRTRLEAKQNMQKGLKNLQSLFNESGSYVPQTLGGYIPKEGSSPTRDDTPPGPSPGNKPVVGASEPAAPTEDPIDAELRKRRAELEKQENSEQKQRELEALQKREDARRRWLQQRAEAEHGALFFSLPPSLQFTQQRLREGWCLLFDGKTDFGWRVQDKGNYGGGRFTIRNGEIRSDPRYPGLMYTTSQFGDSTVMLEYQAEEDSEAYLLLRTSPDPRDIHSSCYAVVLNSRDFTRPTGTVLGRNQFSSEQLAESAKSAQKKQESPKHTPGSLNWSRITVQLEGTRLQVWLDRDEPITLFDAKPLGCGYVGLLVTKGDVRFRKVYWKPGSTVSLFDPVAPDRFWRHQKDSLQLQPTREGTLQLTGGPGVFESKMTYRNFVLQFEYNIAFNSGRGGLFFRSTPRVEQSGYEMSLQNFPTRADRDAVVGVDAGAFRGIKNARYLRPEDQTWNYVTLSVVDRQFQTWVNGVPVCEMSDRRPISDSKDSPPFLEAGSIQFLAPKAGTNIDFRNIRVSPIEPRFEKKTTFEDRAKTTWEAQTKQRQERERLEKLDRQMMGEGGK